MTKLTVFVLILVTGFGCFAALLYAGWPPTYPPKLSGVAAQMVFFGSIAAAISAVRTPGQWTERIRRAERGTRRVHWIWPILFVFLAIANYLVALAVALGSLTFAPRRA